MQYKIRCSFCHKINIFDESKLSTNKKVKIIYCEHCGRAVTIEFNGEKFYESLDI
mgnify:CR=1 FL=1